MTPLEPSDPRQLGPWQLLGRLGSGGMGTVFLGKAEERTAAVKAITPALAGSPDFRARFRREVEICRRVEGPQIAELYDADTSASQPWLAVRYISGSTLDRAVYNHGPLNGPRLDGFALAIAEALRQIHSAGVIHRDLKPSNVILTDSTPVLIDFGIAAAADATALTSTGVTMGSSGWMAPEQILGYPVGPPADVFAWGALVAYASTGQPPFGEGRPESLAYRVVHGAPDLREVPAAYRPIVERALSRDPDERPTVSGLLSAIRGQDASPTRVADAIAETWIGVDDTLVHPPQSDIGGFKPRQRRGRARRVLAISTAAAVGLILGTGALALQDRRSTTFKSGVGAEIVTERTLESLETSTTVVETTTTSNLPTTTTTEASTTTAAPTIEPPPPPPARAEFVDQIMPLTDDVHRLLNFAAEHQQEVVKLDILFNPDGQPEFFNPDLAGSLSDHGLFICASAADPRALAPCWDGLEIHIYDLDDVTDARFYFEHGHYKLVGTFAVQGVSGPHQGVFGLGLRAVPIA